jgi:hypothetical protein
MSIQETGKCSGDDPTADEQLHACRRAVIELVIRGTCLRHCRLFVPLHPQWYEVSLDCWKLVHPSQMMFDPQIHPG